MRKLLRKIFISLALAFFLSNTFTYPTFAQTRCANVVIAGYPPEGLLEGERTYIAEIFENSDILQISIKVPDPSAVNNYGLEIDGVKIESMLTRTQDTVTLTMAREASNNPPGVWVGGSGFGSDRKNKLFIAGNHTVKLYRNDQIGNNTDCLTGYEVQPAFLSSEKLKYNQPTAFDDCSLSIQQSGDSIKVQVNNIPYLLQRKLVKILWGNPFLVAPIYQIRLKSTGSIESPALNLSDRGKEFQANEGAFTQTSPNKLTFTDTIDEYFAPGENYQISLWYTMAPGEGYSESICDNAKFSINKNAEVEDPSVPVENDNPEIKQVCSSISADQDAASRLDCENCVTEGKAYTAFGCIPTDLPTFLSDYLFTIGLGFAGGIAFLLMLWGGFNILISQGDAHKIQMGREIIVSAGVGLLFIIFAIVILQFIGKEIGIPGFK